jgi:hypothetical protein
MRVSAGMVSNKGITSNSISEMALLQRSLVERFVTSLDTFRSFLDKEGFELDTNQVLGASCS